MSDLTRKKDTGEPGNPGQFGHTSKASSGLLLDTAPAPAGHDAVLAHVEQALADLTDNADIDHARIDPDTGDERQGYPHAAHAAAVAALRTYAAALRGENQWPGSHMVEVPLLITPVIYDESRSEPLPDWPANLPTPQVAFELDDDLIATTFDMGEGRVFSVWAAGPDSSETYDTLESVDAGSDADPFRGVDEDDQEAAIEWAHEVHRRILSHTYAAQLAAVNHTDYQATVLATVLGR